MALTVADTLPAEAGRTESLRFAPAFAFVGSGCLLVLEIVAGRMIAPELGVSLYTWTSVIGVVLAGVSIGNFLGGRVADRWPDRSTLSLMYLVGAAASLSVLLAVRYTGSLELPRSAPAFLQVLWVTAVLFLFPSIVLGAPTPLLTRLALHSVDETGRVVGRIQGAAALGSIVGTFLTGFLLISWIGTRHVVVGIAGALFLLSILARPPWLLGRVFELGAFGAVIVAVGFTVSNPCLDSRYFCIRVSQTVENGHVVRQLYLDHLLNGIVAVANPSKPVYTYERFYAASMDKVFRHGAKIDSLMLGGGAYTFPRYLAKTYSGQVTVAEIDPEVTNVARRALFFHDTPRIKVVHGDARRTLREMGSDKKFDLVLGDAFNDFSVPYQLTTKQFAQLVSKHLKPNGLYMINVVDGVNFDFLRSEVRTLREVFPYVGIQAFPFSLPPYSKERSTFVVIAAKRRPAHRLPVILQSQLDAFLKGGHSVVLTDDHVPVDQLLAPVFRRALETGQ